MLAKLSVEQALMKARYYSKKNEITEAQKLYEAVLVAFPKNIRAQKELALLNKPKQIKTLQNPSLAQLHNLLEHYQNGRMVETEKLAISMTQEFPTHQFGWTVLGAVLGQLGRNYEAVNSNQTVVALSPQDAEAHFNLGNTLQELGRLDEAEASYMKAISLNPNYVEAQNNLGNTLKKMDKLEKAETSYLNAITLKPDYAESYFNLGVVFQEQEKLEKAYHSYIKAINLKPNFNEAYLNLILVFKKIRYNSSDPQLYPILTNVLTTRNLTRPSEIARSTLRLLKHDRLVKDLLSKKNIVMNFKKFTSSIDALDKLKLLHHLMRLCPLPDLQFERLFVAIRSFYLTNIDKIQASPKIIYFLSTLSLHCFTNEYVYYESDEETQLIEDLETKILKAFARSQQPESIKILCLACYRPLHKYDWCQKLRALDHLERVKTRLIEEPFAEKIIAKDIRILRKISDNVSLKVKEQYEEHPYPRWVKLAIPLKVKSIAAVCDDIKLHLHSESIKDVTAPTLLIAGCGTGQHSIETASRFSNCQVTAVDLSISSLAYAQRKTNELGISNLKYLQADILDLNKLGRKFDIIESLGVLHHMDKPMDGWRTLTELLKSNGLMKVALYSKLARRGVVKAREKISSSGIGISPVEIKNFRASQIVSKTKDHEKLSGYRDYFSMSEFRDLIFHVQEHRFTLLEIQDCLNLLGLKFCGFENNDIASCFKSFHNKESDICDLALWHQLEEKKPDLFAGMYQFWCQKL